ncbi:hypothetical protein G9A89_017269 [Geosiphon pyriformis]|nr:hypothetical protein G9A89_017269 [Geosiphon pyriformis]
MIVIGRGALDPDNVKKYKLISDAIFKFSNMKRSILNVFLWLQHFELSKILAAETTKLSIAYEEINEEILNRIKKKADSENCLLILTFTTTHRFERGQDGKYTLVQHDLIGICQDIMIGRIGTTLTNLKWLYILFAKVLKV